MFSVDQLLQHIRTMHRGQIFCKKCHKVLLGIRLNEHAKVCTLKCPVCHKEFQETRYVQRHMKRVHGAKLTGGSIFISSNTANSAANNGSNSRNLSNNSPSRGARGFNVNNPNLTKFEMPVSSLTNNVQAISSGSTNNSMLTPSSIFNTINQNLSALSPHQNNNTNLDSPTSNALLNSVLANSNFNQKVNQNQQNQNHIGNLDQTTTSTNNSNNNNNNPINNTNGNSLSHVLNALQKSEQKFGQQQQVQLDLNDFVNTAINNSANEIDESQSINTNANTNTNNISSVSQNSNPIQQLLSGQSGQNTSNLNESCTTPIHPATNTNTISVDQSAAASTNILPSVNSTNPPSFSFSNALANDSNAEPLTDIQKLALQMGEVDDESELF